MKKVNIPTIFVVFGATGDLMNKKIVPALYLLWKGKLLPDNFRVLGISRQDMSDTAFRTYIGGIIKEKGKETKKLDDFIELFHFQAGDFNKAKTYSAIKKHLNTIEDEWKVCANKMYYLAVPPQFMDTIVVQLKKSGLSKPCGGPEGWARVMIEKPFGQDGNTAKSLEKTLAVFKEKQIYRIDHYLGKEMVQEIVNFRFSNNLFEHIWNAEHVERIDMQLSESIGVEDRGAFYDSVGALRDVGQNHLLEILALLTMENPGSGDMAILEKREELMANLLRPTVAQVKQWGVRAQYEGYLDIDGVKSSSQTETYFKIKTYIDNERWKDVPIYIESGKRLGKVKKQIVVTFKRPVSCLCALDQKVQNRVVFSLDPKEGIFIDFWSKKPGMTDEMECRTFDFFLYKRKQKKPYVEEYAKLLLQAIDGDQTWFVGKKEIQAMWGMIDPYIWAWGKNLVPLKTYTPDGNDIALEAKDLLESVKIKKPRAIGIIGLGRMGGGIAEHLHEKNWHVVGYNKTPEATRALFKKGIEPAKDMQTLISALPTPRLVWVMVPSGKAVDDVMFGEDGLIHYLEKGDVVVDGGNSYYKETIRRGIRLKKHGIRFIDAGVSGGPDGARDGACIMAGGDMKLLKEYEHLFRDMTVHRGYQMFEGTGAGHFVKMVHNGIEYGMMQAIGEGFELLKKSTYNLDLIRISDVYNHGSVIESHLVEWLYDAFKLYGQDLKPISGSVSDSGEGLWTVKTAKEMKIPVKIIEGALKFRHLSQKKPRYTGQVVSALRGQFGHHPVLKKKK
jgi:glucose-6-phosphate 1-dehydrogenase